MPLSKSARFSHVIEAHSHWCGVVQEPLPCGTCPRGCAKTLICFHPGQGELSYKPGESPPLRANNYTLYLSESAFIYLISCNPQDNPVGRAEEEIPPFLQVRETGSEFRVMSLSSQKGHESMFSDNIQCSYSFTAFHIAACMGPWDWGRRPWWRVEGLAQCQMFKSVFSQGKCPACSWQGFWLCPTPSLGGGQFSTLPKPNLISEKVLGAGREWCSQEILKTSPFKGSSKDLWLDSAHVWFHSSYMAILVMSTEWVVHLYILNNGLLPMFCK